MNLLCIGLMSGTSMDGIDAALVDTDGQTYTRLLHSESLLYHPNFQIALKAAEYAVRQNNGDLVLAEENFNRHLTSFLNSQFTDQITVLNEMTHYLYKCTDYRVKYSDIIDHSTKLHADLVKKLLKKANKNAAEIDLIGYHGQTLFHNPGEHITVQVGNIALLANEVKITTIGNFRYNDVQNHGQGAPFAPLFHQALAVRDNMLPAAVINCGGISNITIINSSNPLELLGFDTGPGNVLIDQYLRTKTNNKELMDKDGKHGLAGKVNKQVLDALYQKAVFKDNMNYFETPPPKSLDSSNFTLIDELSELSFQDACATLEAFTAMTIVDSLKFFPDDEIPQKFILAGGGWHNRMILQKLHEYLKVKLGDEVKIFKATEVGWDGKSLEAEIFAYLAARTLHKIPISYPNLTRTLSATLGGIAYLPENSPITEKVQQLLATNQELLRGYEGNYSI